MSEEPLTDALMIEHELVSRRLAGGEDVEGREFNRYIGRQGLLLSAVVKSLWTKEAMRKAIDSRMQEFCDACPHQPKRTAGDWILKGLLYALAGLVAAICALVGAKIPCFG